MTHLCLYIQSLSAALGGQDLILKINRLRGQVTCKRSESKRVEVMRKAAREAGTWSHEPNVAFRARLGFFSTLRPLPHPSTALSLLYTASNCILESPVLCIPHFLLYKPLLSFLLPQLLGQGLGWGEVGLVLHPSLSSTELAPPRQGWILLLFGSGAWHMVGFCKHFLSYSKR